MKTQKIKTLSWVSGLLMLSIFLISPDVIAQKRKGQSNKKTQAQQKTPGYGYNNAYYDYGPAYGSYNDYNGGYDYGYNNGYNNGYGIGNGYNRGCVSPGYGYNNAYNSGFRVGNRINSLPRGVRPVWVRGRKYFSHRGFLWQPFRTRRGKLYFQAMRRI